MPTPKNSIEGRALPFVERIERLKGEIKMINEKSKLERKDKQEDIKEVHLEVKAAGLAVRAVKEIIEDRALERRKLERRKRTLEKLDIDEGAQFQVLVETLGDLGRAAAERAGVVVNLAR